MHLPSKNILLTGVPRSGTTLCCKLINQSSDAVALVEPINAQSVPVDVAGAASYIFSFLSESRQCIDAGEPVGSMLTMGAVADNIVGQQRNARGLRIAQAKQGHMLVNAPCNDYRLIIKHNALFAALLPVLSQSVPIYAVVRNPLSVLASWNSVDLPVAKGRLPMGERYSKALSTMLNEESDVIARQLIILNWLFEQFQVHLPSQQIINYEQLVTGQSTPLSEVATFKHSALTSHNMAYKSELLQRLLLRLKAAGGAWDSWYSAQELDALL